MWHSSNAPRCALMLMLFSACDSRSPQLLGASPKTLCANNDSQLVLTGVDLDPESVQIGLGTDLGTFTTPVTAASVSGTGTLITASFPKDSLTPSDTPYDVVYTDKNGSQLVLPGAVKVVAGISISAVDPGEAYNGVDFPTSIYGTGMGGVATISIQLAGGTAVALTQVTAIDDNRADGVVPKGTPVGSYDVTVTDADGCTATLPGALVVTADLTVSICGVDPAFGYDMEDTDVTITATTDGTAGGATCGGKSGKYASTPRAWLVIGGALEAVDNLSFVSAGSLTGTVPKGLPVGGPYDLLVQNPDGTVGLLAAAFKVVDLPVPQVTAIDPPTVKSNFNGAVKIFGKNFRAPVKVEVYGPNGVLKNVPSPAVASPTEVDVTLDATGLGLVVGAYVVRVTDTDQSTLGEYSVLAVISASGNIVAWTDLAATPLPDAVMRHGAAAGQVSPAARYLYVVGGDSGGATPTRRDGTQIATLDKFGNVGDWFTGHNRLPEARTALEVVLAPAPGGAGGYLYAIGGNSAAATVSTVSRAKILLPAEAPRIDKSSVTLGGTLPRGAFYYRVSAVLDGTDVANPLGETLPSEEATAHTVAGSKVSLTWTAVAKAASYRVFRTASVNGTSKQEVLLADNLPGTSFVDDGSAQPGAASPLTQGELGVWVTVSPLKRPRRAIGATLAHDPAGKAFLYVIGGDQGTTFANAVTLTDVYDTYEYAEVTDDGLTLGAFTEDTGLNAADKLNARRTRLRAGVGEHGSSPAVPMGTTYVYAVGGFGGAAVVASYQSAAVQAGGKLLWGLGDTSVKIQQGLTSLVVSNFLFCIGGANGAGTPTTDAASGEYTNTPAPPLFGATLNANNAAGADTGAHPIASFAALAFGSAHFFVVGGTVDGTTALKRVWTQVY